MKKVILLIAFVISVSLNAQVKRSYTSTIMSEDGAPMQNVMVRVRGTGQTVYTNVQGEFTVNANPGDVLIISKDGKRINTLTLDNSNFYEIEDTSESLQTKQAPVSAPSKSRYGKVATQNNFKVALDSAQYYSKIKPEGSISLIEGVLQSQSKTRGNPETLARAYSILGDVYMHLKQFDLAVTNFESALNFKPDNVTKFKLAKAYTLDGNFVESSEMYNELLQEKNLNIHQQISIYEGLGDNSSQRLDELDEAVNHYKKGLQLAEANDVEEKITDLNDKIGYSFSSQGETEVAESFYSNSLKSTDSIETIEQARSRNSVADFYADQRAYDKEIELRKQTLSAVEGIQLEEAAKEPPVEISAQKLNLDIGNAYLNKGDLAEAEPYLEKSIEEASKANDLETQKDALQKLSELNRAAGKSDEALEKYQEYAKLVDVLYQQKEQEIKEAVSLGIELTNKQNRINSLEKDRELSETRYNFFQSQRDLTVESYRRQQVIIYALLSGVLLLIFSLFWMYKSNKQRRFANNLLALKSLRSQMNPHFIFNALNSVNSFVAQNDERAANRFLTDFSRLMRSVLDNSEEDFIPLSKEIELLSLYLKLEHSRFADKFDYTLDIDKQIEIDAFEIPPMLLQPYVENAVWHGLRYKKEVGYLRVVFKQQDIHTVEIVIEDNGIGRNQSKLLKTQHQKNQQSKGMGNIKKRIAILNTMYGNKVAVRIEDLLKDNTGTKVILTLKR
ncbi:hypothetical protein KH5_11620 [Urechidicola sp. KH5]